MSADLPADDPWARLRGTTRARIGLGRTGDALPVAELLAFQLAHARARDAVHAALDPDAVEAAVAPATVLRVRSQAPDRATYLRRPDLGRRLDPACHASLDAAGYDAVFVIADGLSPAGVQRHAPALLAACRPLLPGWTIGPVVIATEARVALGDEIGHRLGARFCVMLIGERPGLSVASSLGAYWTYDPRPGRRDSERNCISNIHEDGLSYDAAADMLCWLMFEGARRQLTGVALKDDRPGLLIEG